MATKLFGTRTKILFVKAQARKAAAAWWRLAREVPVAFARELSGEANMTYWVLKLQVAMAACYLFIEKCAKALRFYQQGAV
jgi:hypothetical protein